MHIKTNICDNLLGTMNLLDGEKNKYSRNAHLDIKMWRIRPELYVPKDPTLQKKLPTVIHTLNKIQKSDMCKCLKILGFQMATHPTYQDVQILLIES